MRTELKIKMELLSDTIFSSGTSSPAKEDIALRFTPDGWPVLPGSTLKGLLKESMANWFAWSGANNAQADLDAMFGCEGYADTDDARRLAFGDLELAKDAHPLSLEECIGYRTFTEMENGIVADGSLRSATCLRKGLMLEGVMLCDKQDVDAVNNALKAIKWAGLLRSRGFGRVRLSKTGETELAALSEVKPSEWLHYRLKLKTPLSVPWLTRSGAEGEVLNDIKTRTYLPGSAVRGMVVSSWAQTDPKSFEASKAELLGDGTRFLNAVPQGTIPTPKGFYEDKAYTRFYSILDKEVEAGDKRASLGAFAKIENGVISTMTPPIEHSVRINRKDKEIFTVERISAGTFFEGYVHLENKSLASEISKYFCKEVTLGADKYAGSGLCEVVTFDAESPHWLRKSVVRTKRVPSKIDMLLLSPMSMQRDGEPCGLNTKELAKALGVTSVEIIRSATSMTERTGYNRKYGCRLPEIPMYEQGSVFRLKCTPAPSAEALRSIELEGLGMGRAEGFGQALFVNLDVKNRETASSTKPVYHAEAADVLRRARCKWLMDNEVPNGLSNSQLGDLQTTCEYSIQKKEANCTSVREYLEHNKNDKDAAHADKFDAIVKKVTHILDTSLAVTLDLHELDESLDTNEEKLRLLCDWFDLNRKRKE